MGIQLYCNSGISLHDPAVLEWSSGGQVSRECSCESMMIMERSWRGYTGKAQDEWVWAEDDGSDDDTPFEGTKALGSLSIVTG